MTPDSDIGNPHCTSFAENESSFLTFDGDLIDTTNSTRKICFFH